MELALQVVGLKMTGKIEDARHIAMRIVGNTGGPEPGAGMSTNVGGAMQLSSHLLRGRAGESVDFEQTLLDFLAVLDAPLDGLASSSDEFLSKQTLSGQTLLHLAALAKFPALSRFLVARGIDLDARDNNGCTALFLAALTNSAECARVLVAAGAALDVVNAAGRTPAEVGPAGFFDFLGASDSDRSLDVDGSTDDEGAWADVDEASDSEPEPPRSALRRRAIRRSSHRSLRPRASFLRAPLSDVPPVPPLPVSSPDAKPGPSPLAAEKKALEAAGVGVDEKQAATFTETLYRTLAQLQHPQGMIPNLPLPNMHMPALPGIPIPAWGALPQMTAVFPVLVPLWGARKDGEVAGEGEDAAAAPGQLQMMGRLGIPSAQDWRAFWEKWMQQATQAQATREHEHPPPAYTPRSTDEPAAFADAKAPEGEARPEPVEEAPAQETELRERAAAARRVGYGDAAVPEEEVQLYGYRPTRKPARRAQKKRECCGYTSCGAGGVADLGRARRRPHAGSVLDPHPDQ